VNEWRGKKNTLSYHCCGCPIQLRQCPARLLPDSVRAHPVSCTFLLDSMRRTPREFLTPVGRHSIEFILRFSPAILLDAWMVMTKRRGRSATTQPKLRTALGSCRQLPKSHIDINCTVQVNRLHRPGQSAAPSRSNETAPDHDRDKCCQVAKMAEWEFLYCHYLQYHALVAYSSSS